MKKCKDCGVEITEKNKVIRKSNGFFRLCRKCWNKRSEIYRRKKGIGLEKPCQVCGKMVKRKAKNHFCSPKCKFMNKIKKNKNGCWDWEGQCNLDGYGKFFIGEKRFTASRYSYELFKGKIPKGKLVCHTCDNRKCVNPDHLWIGTCKDNIQDMIKKKRKNFLKGSQIKNSKLTEKDIPEIRKMHKEGMRKKEISSKYKVALETINDVIKKITWKHV